MTEGINIERKGRIVHVTLDRPDKGNLFTREMKDFLAATANETGRNDDACAVVLRGNGEDFCHGREQKVAGGPPKTAMDAIDRVMNPILQVYEAFRNCPVPIISAVHGKALGFGCALVGGSDIAYASEDARFALPEMTHGTAPTLAMSAVAKVAPKTIADLVLSVEEIDAQTALAAGLVSRVVPTSELDATVNRLLDRLSGFDPVDIKTVKRFLWTGLSLPPDIMADLASYTLASVRTRG
jgi:enoyl-CoA hydratase/carnithine racemase